jgi:hypothetical protein
MPSFHIRILQTWDFPLHNIADMRSRASPLDRVLAKA